MEVRDLLELVIWTGLVMTRTMARAAQVLLEWLFVAATWIALLLIGAVMAFQRGGLPWVDPTDARTTSRTTSRSAGSRVRRAPLR
jgi:hypothetical protein